MDIDDVHDTTASFSDINFDLEEESNKVESLRVVSCSGDLNGEVGNAGEVITRMELDLACFCEKIENLNILMMHVATWESEFEAIITEEDNVDLDSGGKALEYNLLSGILDSEVTELDKFMAILHTEITSAGEIISSHNHLGETFMLMEEKLHDYEQLLKQSQDQVSEIRIQSAKFQRTLTHFIGEDNRNVKNNMILLEDDQSSNINAKINMQTTEQQRHILRMLEKSLAKEMDLEKKFNESRQIEEELKLRILSVEEELVRMEEEATDIWERLFEADNAHEVLMGISRDLLGRLQISHFNSNGLNLLEHELRTKLEISTEQLKSKEAALQKLEFKTAESNGFLLEQTNGLKSMLGDTENKLVIANSEAFSLKEKVSSLEKQLQEFELQLLNAKASLDGSQEQHHNVSCSGSEVGSLISELRERVYEAESKVDKVEAKCKLLTKCNLELNEELTFLKGGGGGTSEKVDLLERQLRESDIQLQHALASAEASQEKQTMLYSTISDMDNVIRDLKSKVSKAETRAENVEEKCIILSESNADLTEELVFLRSKLEYLEGSLHQAEETKMANAKDIGIRTKTITDLVMRLAIERERLRKQISSLAKENKILVAKIQEANKDSFVVINDESRGSSAQETKEGVSEFSATGYKINTAQKNMSAYDNEVKPADSISNVGTVRRVDAGILNSKHLFMAMLVLLVSASIYLLQQEKCPF